MRLNQNLASLNIYREHSKNIKAQSKALNRISSGYKVNSASENPNGISQSEKLRMQIRGIQMAQKNIQDGVSMLQTADSGLDNITSMLHRIRELSVQAGGGAMNEADRAVIQTEINQMVEAIDKTTQTTEFNGVKLLYNEEVSSNTEPQFMNMPSGANVDERIKIPTYNLSATKIGNIEGTLNLKDLDVTSQEGLNKALSIVDGAMDTVQSARSKYGALQNRFESSYQSLSAISESLTRAESGIRDTDMAEEMLQFSKNGILIEAGTAMMVQSNRFPQDILRILENLRK